MAGAVRKRTWTTRKGETRTAWFIDYYDRDGERHREAFATKRAADARLTVVKTEIGRGIHTPVADSIIIAEAAEMWLAHVRSKGIDATTLRMYRGILDTRILPILGRHKLALLTRPQVEAFSDALQGEVGWHRHRHVLSCLKCLIDDARRRGLAAQNVARGVKLWRNARAERKLEIGRDIPSKEDVRELLAAAGSSKWRAFIAIAVFTGMRVSEVLGLEWQDVDFDNRAVHVRQRLSRLQEIGSPKSKAGQRTIPLAPIVVQLLLEWRVQCPRSAADKQLKIVFPNRYGQHSLYTSVQNWFYRLQASMGWGEKPRYRIHSLRHFFASWCIQQGFSAKRLQILMGHASITMSMDTYGHWLPSDEDDRAKFSAGEAGILAAGKTAGTRDR